MQNQEAIQEALKPTEGWEDREEFLTLQEAGLENVDFDTVTSLQVLHYYSQEA